MSDAITIPQEFIDAGARFVLLAPCGKIPIEKDWETVNNYDATSPKLQAHIAAGGNYGVLSRNGLGCIDIDKIEEFQKYHSDIPKRTLCVARGEHGHVYFICLDCPPDKLTKIETTFGDIRLGGNFQTVGANCVHPSGDRYNIVNKVPIAVIPFADIAPLLNGHGKLQKEQNGSFSLPDVIPEGERNNTLYKYGCSLRARGLDTITISELLKMTNVDRCHPPIPSDEFTTLVQSVAKVPPGKVVIPPPFPNIEMDKQNTESLSLTEIAAAEDFVRFLGGNCIYNIDQKKWHVWNGKIWEVDTRNAVKNKCRLFIKGLYSEISKLDKKDERRKWLRDVESLNTNRGIENILILASLELSCRNEDFDLNLHILVMQNGTLEFTDEGVVFREHRKEDMCSKICGVAYLKDEPIPEIWTKHINRIMCDDDELKQSFQMLTGYILDGGNQSERVVIAHGSGRNGKSVTFRTLATALGDYAVTINPDTLMSKGVSSERSPERLKMRGARFIIAQEPNKPPEDAHRKDLTILDTGFLKAASGRDKISARYLNSNVVETFCITGVVALITNPLPKVIDNSTAWWDRLFLCPFDCYIPDDERDEKMEEKFKDVLPGIMNWFIKGWEEYRNNKCKLKTCDAIKCDIEEYRSEVDEYAGFIQRCVLQEGQKGKEVSARALYDEYKRDCMIHSTFAKDPKTFGLAMSSRFSKNRKKTGIMYRDIALKTGQQHV